QESLLTKERESRAAYRFIDSQVGLYHRTLSDAEDKLAKYRKTHPEARPGAGGRLTTPVSPAATPIGTRTWSASRTRSANCRGSCSGAARRARRDREHSIPAAGAHAHGWPRR